MKPNPFKKPAPGDKKKPGQKAPPFTGKPGKKPGRAC